MEQQPIPTRRLSRAQLDPLRSPVLQQELPGLSTALDEEAMRPRLQGLLFGQREGYLLERCNPGQAIYLAGDFCGLRYELEVRDQQSGGLIEPLVVGRVFQHATAAREFFAAKLAPLIEQARGRADLAIFTIFAALIEPLNMVLHAFPLDGDLPVLLDVADPQRALEILKETLPDALEQRFLPTSCEVELAHYGRQHRCTLRYVLSGAEADGGTARRVVYGKVAADGSGERTMPVISALREQIGAIANIPRALAFRPDIQLLLLEAIPGKPQVARMLKQRLAGQPARADDALTLDGAIEACGRIAAAMHGASISLGRQRTLDSELEWLDRSIATLSRVSPELGAHLHDWLERTADYARRAAPLPLGFGHGDFTYTQLIFEGQQSGLVDFDTVCQCEPALDLGQFLAYQRLAILKDQRRDAPMPRAEIDQLCERFLSTYIAARAGQIDDQARLRDRVAVYQILMLLRLALHSWQKLKVSRLDHALTLLEEQVSCLR